MAKKQSNNSLGKEIYDDAGKFGNIMAIIGAIVGTLIGIAMIVGGAMLVRSKTVLTAKTTGTIVNDPECTVVQNTSDTNCINIEIDYEIDGADYTTILSSSAGAMYKKGEVVTLYYDPEDPEGAQLQSDNFHTAGWITIVFGILILISGWAWYFITRASKFAAVAGGAGATVRLLKAV